MNTYLKTITTAFQATRVQLMFTHWQSRPASSSQTRLNKGSASPRAQLFIGYLATRLPLPAFQCLLFSWNSLFSGKMITK